ncbi:MAG: response regulator [Bacteroidota bacterium]
MHFPDSYFNAHDVDPSFPDVLAWIKATGFALNDSNGVPDRIVLMHENITARKHAEAMFEDIVDKNPLSIQIVDKDGYTITGNPAYIKLFGAFPPPGFSIFADLQGKSPELEKLILHAKRGEVVHLPDLQYNTKDVSPDLPDNPVWIRALIFPLNDSAGIPERYVLMHENITEGKLAEQELIIAKERAEESDHLKSAFLANMSHEIRTPMNGILGFASLLKEPNLTGDEQQKYIGIIEKSGARMLNIINDIVDISKIEAGLMELDLRETNINDQIEYIYTFFKPEVEAKGMQLCFKNSLPAKEALIVTDREKIYAILTNLVKNAIKYTNEGSIEFGYNVVGSEAACCLATTAASFTTSAFLEFYVKDTGIGIAKNRQEAIFERFIQADILDTRAYQGAGLGLTITKAYVEMLGGKIRVDSEPGKGSTFYFTISYNTNKQNQRAVANTDSQEDESVQFTNVKILIAEDDETSDFLITSMLKKNNHEVLHTKTGIETIEVCHNNPDIDLILMDIRMPNINGYEATQQIRQFNKEVIIIAQTAYGLSGDRQKAIDAGCNEYLSKPIDKDELLRLMQKHFKK